ncbi:MAG TPA: GNAT family protein [Xanthomonadaceae bacterium]|jgi:RimJ/RimL family protein N-acetyltransferase|nr:GNAT family protein [Xanthomonadaceae bacterium]
MDPWKHPPRLAGRHVVLEPLRREHADGLGAVVEDGRLWELWFTNVPRPQEIQAYVDAALSMQAAGGCLAFTVRDADGRIAGMTRYYDLAPAVPRVQIGYTWYARRVQRTGLNTEAKLLLLAHAFDTLGCASVGLQTSTHNHASRAAIVRLGAREDGVLRNHLRHRDGSLRDTVCFSITDAEWPQVRANLQARLAEHAA